jgi:hypothetical protein
MSDDKSNNEDFGALTNDDDDSGFGNLPPLSDFDSGDGGLPPIVDIKVDTPAVRPSDLDTPESSPAVDTSGGGFDTPAPGGLGFQDFAADSDFSPETPDIGPGPDSDIETPMFDSAFGGNTDDFSTPGGTPAPTQAMETLMFETGGQVGSGIGFDNDAFGAPTPDTGGTPIPDFSPDTVMNAATPPPNYAAGGGGGGGGTSKGVLAIVAVIAIVIGAALGGYFSPSMDLNFIPNPPKEKAENDAKTQISAKNSEIGKLNKQIEDLNIQLTDGNIYSQEKIDELKADYERYTSGIETTQNEIAQATQDLADAKKTLDARNDAIAAAQTQLEKAMKDEAISQARNQGLRAENAQLVNNVGELEDANARRQATLDTLIHNVNLLDVQIQGSSPLAPQRFSHKSRINKVAALKSKVSSAKWVTPQLLNEYTDLYIAELGIASSREYFFAKIPIHDSLDIQYEKWAECLMNGNWSVYYRTLDGTYVGTYENTSPSGAPKYAFREDLPESMKSDISAQLSAARPDDYDAKYKILMGKEAIHDNETNLQKKFSSLLK